MKIFMRSSWRATHVVLVALFTVWTLAACSGPATKGPAVPPPGSAAIASADPLATAAGMAVLEAGGNAFDAAVAVAATLGVVEPSSSGFGGGGFFLLYLADSDEYRFIDARETAPAAATRDMYLDVAGNPIRGATVSGALAAGIPGEPAGMVYLAEQYGSKPLAELLAPAIRHAEEGFVMNRRNLLGLRFRKSAVTKSPAMAGVFLPGGKLPAAGDAAAIRCRWLRRLL